MTWKTDSRSLRTFGPYIVYSERDGGDTAHLVAFPDGRKVRVLPDGRNSGQRRSRVTSDALAALQQPPHIAADAALYFFVGLIVVAGLSYELVLPEVTIEEWLVEWLEAGGSATQLLMDLGADGWAIVRKGEA